MSRSVIAVLGPTNTGKTHYAVERMLAHRSGVMGFPLRLLAREVYDRVVAAKGKNVAALITGEERIVPPGARYFLCTAEAMPRHRQVDFVAIDEIQMAADPERGHVFTEHLLYTRGTHETLFLGAETMRNVILSLLPDTEIMTRPRMSKLSYVKPAKLARLPRRSALVGFSASDVYGMAELVRRTRGGTAIVMGALSPRTRNAQVEMYQSGEVDYLVATDAIGMGLNMDIHHVAFAGLQKFDGRVFRDLNPAEAAQIAGRAGRHQRDGTFSTLSGGDPMDSMMVAQIEEHQFEPIKKLVWRNPRLEYTSVSRLIHSLEMRTDHANLHRQRDAADLLALKALADNAEVTALANRSPDLVKLLWEVAQIPDFRKLNPSEHHHLMARLFKDLTGQFGVIADSLMDAQVKRLDNVHGDIDILAGRLASIRVWTYVSHRSRWLKNAEHWAHVTRSVEDKLSDALHERLTQRFVDRRTAVLMRALKQRGDLSVSIDSESQQVSVEGHDIGQLQGFTFKVEPGASRDDQKTLKAAAETALRAEILRRAKLFNNVGVKTMEIDFSAGLNKPQLTWEGSPFAKLVDSGAFLAPRVKLLDGTLLDGEAAELVLKASQDWLDARIAEKLDPLLKLASELNGEAVPPEGVAPLSGTVRGIAYRLLENFGVLARSEVAEELRSVDQENRKALRRFGIRIGAYSLYIPFILKPHATELRLAMWAMAQGEAADTLPGIPTPGMVWCERAEGTPNTFYSLAGFVAAGTKAVRMDMMERLADAVRPLGQDRDWFEVTPEIMGLVGLSGDDFAAVMEVIGYKNEVRQVPAPSNSPAAAEETAKETAETPDATEEAPKADAEAEAVTATEAEAPAVEVEGAPEGDAEATEAELVDRHFFRWGPRRQGGKPSEGRQARGDRGEGARKGGGRNAGGRPRKGGKGGQQDRQPRVHTSGPKPRRNADPDSPFAALAGLRNQLKK